MRIQTFAFDVYGTLIDTEGVNTLLEDFLGAKAMPFSALWRSKQLEYSFRRGLMDQYVDFSICTAQALEYSCEDYGVQLTDEQKNALMQTYGVLPAFSDVADCLEELKAKGHRIFAFSNGSLNAIHGLLEHSKLQRYFDGAVSMETVQTFKPDPKGYEHFIQSTSANKENAWLVSGNTFDVIGAAACGMKTIWLRRNRNVVLDPMGYKPTLVLKSLVDLPQEIEDFLLP